MQFFKIPRVRTFAKYRCLRIEPLEERTVPTRSPLAEPMFAPGTPQDYVDRVHDAFGHSDGQNPNAFQSASKWSTTATNGPVSTREAVVLTWGIVPDGMLLVSGAGETNTASTLRGFMDGLYGAGPGGSDLTLRPWFSLFQNSLNRNAAVSGLTYVYHAADDSAAFNSSPGVLNVRPDVRIGGHSIDGASNILAYNYYPNGGDMVIDTDDGGFVGNTTNTSRAFRNILMHEQGHGVGLAHEEPVQGNTLMEPFLNTSFDGPQFDDVLGFQRFYGDTNERGLANATTGNATPIGNLTVAVPITRGASANTGSELTGATAIEFVSIDDDSDVDVYSFSADPNVVMTAIITPVGPTYQSGPQGGTPPPITFVSSQQSNLTLEFLDSGGAVVATANAGGLGVAETITGIYSGLLGGSFFVRVTGAQNTAQMYQLQLSAVVGGSTVAVVSGNLQAIGTSSNNQFTVIRNGSNYRITDVAGAIAGSGASQINATTVDVPIGSIGGIIDIRGNDGTDSIAIDLSGGDITPAGGILFTGGNGTDTVVGPNVAGTWSISGAGAGTLTATGATTLTFIGMENIAGGILNDSFTFAGGSLAGAINGGTGSDTIVGDNTGRTFSITGTDAGSVVIVSSTSFTSVENLTGGSAADSFLFTGSGVLTGAVDGGSGSDSLTGTNSGLIFTLSGADSGSVSTILAGFLSVETLVGGTGTDSLLVQLGASLSGSFNAGSGTDSVDLSVLTSQNLTISALGSTDGFNITGSPVAGGLLNVNSLIGTSNSDSLTGRNAASTWTISAANAGTYVDGGTARSLAITSVEALTGGTAIDTFQFATGGSLSGAVVGGSGNDLLIGDNVSRTFSVTGSDSGDIGTILPAGFTIIENLQGGTAGDSFVFGAAGVLTGTLNGGNGSDTLTGSDSSLVFSITGANAGNVGSILAAGFSNVENLQAGSANDTLTFGASGSLSGTIQGGSGTDTLFGNDANLNYGITGSNAGSIVGVLAAGFSAIENITAGSGSDTFQINGGSLTGTLDGGASNDLFQLNSGTLSGTLLGNAGDDTFELNGGSFSGSVDGGADQDEFFLNGGSLTGLLDGGTENDSLSGSNLGQSFNITGTNSGVVPGLVSSFANVETLLGGTGSDAFNFGISGLLNGTIDGGTGTDSLSGTDAGHSFTINGSNAGTVSAILVNGFSGIENLTGGSGSDSFQFNTPGVLSGAVNGGAGADTILGDNAARNFNITGANAGTIGTLLGTGFTNVENLQGGSAVDSFTFGPGSSLSGTVTGGAGNDTLTGDNVGRTYSVTGSDAGTVVGLSAFTGIENLVAGSGPDSLVRSPSGSLSGTFDGRGGSDTADLSPQTVAQAVFLTGSNSEGFSASLAGMGFAKGLDQIVATSKNNDQVVGLGVASAWQVKAGANQTYYRRTTTGETLYLTGFEQMFGNAATDAYNVDFSAGVPIGTSGLTLNGAGGSDSINVIGTAVADSFSIVVGTIAVNGRTIKHSAMENIAVRGGNGADTFVAGIGLPVGLALLELFGDAGNDFAKVVPSTNTKIVFNGGTGTDRLRVDTTQSGAPLLNPPPGVLSGTYFFAIHKPIDFLSVETREFGAVP